MIHRLLIRGSFEGVNGIHWGCLFFVQGLETENFTRNVIGVHVCDSKDGSNCLCCALNQPLQSATDARPLAVVPALGSGDPNASCCVGCSASGDGVFDP